MNAIKMKSIVAGPEIVLHIGEKYGIGEGENEVSETFAKDLVEGNYAEYAELPRPKGFAPDKETASLKPPETAGKGKAGKNTDKQAVKPPVASDEEIIEAISKVTQISDLYAFQVEGRSQAVEDAINAKGTALDAALKATVETPKPAFGN